MDKTCKKAVISIRHYEALDKIPHERDQLSFLKAVIAFQLYGVIPEGLDGNAREAFLRILPDLEVAQDGR